MLGDTKFTLGQPMTATWAANFIRHDGVNSDTTRWRQDLTVPEKPVLKRLTTNHQLATAVEAPSEIARGDVHGMRVGCHWMSRGMYAGSVCVQDRA